MDKRGRECDDAKWQKTSLSYRKKKKKKGKKKKKKSQEKIGNAIKTTRQSDKTTENVFSHFKKEKNEIGIKGNTVELHDLALDCCRKEMCFKNKIYLMKFGHRTRLGLFPI